MTTGGETPNAPCIFPFKFNDETHINCIKDEDGYWCSTKVDIEGFHYASSGKWGICGPNCPGVPKGKNAPNFSGTQHFKILMPFSYRKKYNLT